MPFNHNIAFNWSTKICIVSFAMVCLKLSSDARKVKDMVFENLLEHKKLNLKWISIFKRLPVGIMITNEDSVLHANSKMKDIIGLDQINVTLHYLLYLLDDIGY